MKAKTALIIGIIFSAVMTGVIWALGGRLLSIPHAPDTGYLHYYWKLIDPTVWTKLSYWMGYGLHQIALWIIIYRANKQQNVNIKSETLSQWNVAALVVNALFILLHLLQTHLFYDGLAQDTPVWSSQGSVILMLVLFLIIGNMRRGMFFGKKINWSPQVHQTALKWHSYYIAFALVYTFWYHPMEATQAHLLGFFYMFLLFVQFSLFHTKVHMNALWAFFLEFFVLIHGTFVAVQQQNNMWAMFAFGFGAMAVVTQIYGLKLRKQWIVIISTLYLVLALLVYSGLIIKYFQIKDINQIIRIPAIEYILVFILAGIMGLVSVIKKSAKETIL